MKIAASDYDGTLFRENRIAKEDAAAVKAWREAGHKFGVVSGRDYGMLMPQLDYYGIGSDYAVCNNGALICDAEGNILWQGDIPLKTLAEMVKLPEVRRSFHFAFSAADCTYLYHEREGSWITREAREWDFKIVSMREEDILKLPRIHQFCLGFTEPAEADAVSSLLNDRFGDVIHAYPNRCSVDITPRDVSKRQGIASMTELMGWQESEIYAIGDETNDLPMIEAFDGYTVDTARSEIKKRAKKVYAGVGAMLADNM